MNPDRRGGAESKMSQEASRNRQDMKATVATPEQSIETVS